MGPPQNRGRSTLAGQRQDALKAQLLSVAVEAQRIGCYDAADWIRGQADRMVSAEAFDAAAVLIDAANVEEAESSPVLPDSPFGV